MTQEEEHFENEKMLEKSETSGNNNDLLEEQTNLTQELELVFHPGTECNGHLEDDEYYEDDDDEDMQCGLGDWKPSWLQIFASKQGFLFVFCIAWVLQGMYHTYFVSAITTIEKLFQIQSKTTGIIMSATEIGQIGSSLLLTYYGGQGHRPKWIGWGMALFAVSSFTCSLPHFIYGKQLLINANDYNGITKEPNVCRTPSNTAMLFQSDSNFSLPENFTTGISHHANTFLQSGSNFFPGNYTSGISHDAEQCEEMKNTGNIVQDVSTNVVLSIFFISLLGVGMGQTAVYTLGIPYIDDNVANKESPLYFAITIGVRILGPAMGFIVGSLCTSIYADLSVDPKIESTDPRWVGAWWLGLVVISGFLMLAALAMFTFPNRLPGPLPPRRRLRKRPSIKDFPKAVKRLLKNDILMFRTASSVLHILPIAGLYTFLPKYLETQFRLPTPSANMISGVGGILVMGLGIIISGVFILRVKPNARFAAGWIAFTAVVYAIGMGILMFIGCPTNDLAGLKDNKFDLQQLTCNSSCDCNIDKLTPICGQDGLTYLSPCHAGCQNYTKKDGKIVEYSDCMCLNITEGELGRATIGYCDLECSNFVLYIVLFCVFVFVHSTSEVGSMLLILRCVDPKDKAMALGLIQFAIGLFGNVPCPIVYGAVVDSACLVWKMTCGEKGACGLYDSNVFRKYYHGITGALLLCGFFADVVVWYKAKDISFGDEEKKPQGELHTITTQIKKETE